MKHKAGFSLFLILLVYLTFSILSVSYVRAEDASNSSAEEEQEKIEDLYDDIEKYEKKLASLKGKEQTLSSEIEYSDSQIALTELRIQSTIANIAQKEKEIIKLANDIEDLKIRIVKLEKSIDYQRVLLGKRLREKYKSYEESPIVMLLGPARFLGLVQKDEYLAAAGIQDQNLMIQMDQTKSAYAQQKELVEDKKAEEEALKLQIEGEKANLESYRGQLEAQKEEKRRLLEITQNDEAKYQRLLEEAQRELNQIMGAVSVLINQKSREVKKGEVIGIQGNTGFSSGEHLHFGVYRYSSFKDIDGWNWYYSDYVDPAKVLKKKDVYWNTGCESAETKSTGKGDWNWPVSNPTISQGFGTTCWSRSLYGGKPHPAYDMYGSYGSPIYAVEKGDAYFCRNCLGDGANGVFIFHPDDYMTVYWHLR